MSDILQRSNGDSCDLLISRQREVLVVRTFMGLSPEERIARFSEGDFEEEIDDLFRNIDYMMRKMRDELMRQIF